MSSSRIPIPERVSSKFVLEKTIRLRESRSELKRKLASTSFESSPIEYQKLKIEELETEVDEQRFHKASLDIEHAERKLSDTEYRNAQRSTNVRIVSLGDDLWRQKQGLRELEEKSGKIPPIGPDSQAAFVYTLLALYRDPHVHSKRSSSVQSAMRKSSIKVYESSKDAPAGHLWCPVSQDYCEARWMKAAHIVPSRLGASLVEYIFEPGASSRLHTPDNCLIVHATVESNFDNGNFVLIPADPTESPIKTWKIQIANWAAKHSQMGYKRLGDLDGKPLLFKNDRRPAARFLYYHFVVTLLRNKRDRQPGWEKYFSELGTLRPFATPGRYMRQSMLLILAKSTGDLDAEEEARLLGEAGQETFEEEQRLEEGAELEIGRRVFAAYEGDEDEEYAAYESDDDEEDEAEETEDEEDDE